jgi:hypothetical protein
MAATIGNTLRTAFEGRDPLVAVDAAGAIPFFSGLRSLDMLGLNDAHIARHHDESFGRGVQGHEVGDGDYVLSREPDIIVAGVLGSSQLAFRSGREMSADPRFHAQYRRVRLRGEEPTPVRFNIFCRLEGRVGVLRSDGMVRFPGYLFASVKHAQAELDARHKLGTRFVEPVQGALRGVELSEGTWHLSAIGTGAFRLSARRQEDGDTAHAVPDGIELRVQKPGPIDVAVIGDPPAFLSEVVARRIGD